MNKFTHELKLPFALMHQGDENAAESESLLLLRRPRTWIDTLPHPSYRMLRTKRRFGGAKRSMPMNTQCKTRLFLLLYIKSVSFSFFIIDWMPRRCFKSIRAKKKRGQDVVDEKATHFASLISAVQFLLGVLHHDLHHAPDQILGHDLAVSDGV